MNRKEFTLVWVNRVRKVFNKKPLASLPKGIIGSAWKCPVALALGAEVADDSYISIRENGVVVKITEPPISVCKFILDFDMGKYPELVR